MIDRHIIKKISVISLSLILLSTLSQLSFGSSHIYSDTASREQLDQITRDKEETRRKIEQAEREQGAYALQVEEVEGKLLSVLEDLKNLNEKMLKIKSESDRTTLLLISNENEISILESELEEKKAILDKRIASAYKENSRNILHILLKAEDFIDFFSQLKILNLLIKQDAEIVEEVKGKKAELLSIKKEILRLREKQDADKKEIEKLINISEQKNREIEAIYDQKVELLSNAKANKDALIAMENQLIAKENEITSILQDYDYGDTPSGRLLWPTNGKLSSVFGPRTNKNTGTTRMHNGIDIYAPMGTPVIAADSGQVLIAEYHGGYGYAILVYHGGGVATYYAHLSGFAVSETQYVQKGQIIGYVGNTGYTTGYHLHFEVRINGTPQNPSKFL